MGATCPVLGMRLSVDWLFGCEDKARGRSQAWSANISIHGHAIANHFIHSQESIKYNIFVVLNQNQSRIPGDKNRNPS